jgi:replicative DNA helicase
VGGAAYISSLVNAVPTSANAEYYAQIVARLAIARRAVHAAGQIAALAYNEQAIDALELRRKCMDLILKATQDNSRERGVRLSLVLDQLLKETYDRIDGDLGAHLLLPGFSELDRLLVGFEPGDLIYLAARPRMGKSGLGQAILRNIARQLARTGGTCDYVTLEMTAMQQARRMVASEGQINTKAIRAGFRDVVNGRRDDVDAEMFQRFVQALHRIKEEVGEVIVMQEEGMTVEELRDHVAQVVAERDCRFVLVDQLDLFAGEGGRQTPTEHVAHISKTLKQIAKDFKVVVLCLVQLNRNLESRAGVQGKRPQLSDLYMSGRLEMDPDIILFMNRPCVYEPGLNLVNYDSYTEVWGGKVRDGDADWLVPFCFTGRFATFSEWPEDWLRPPLPNDPEGEQAWEERQHRLTAWRLHE